MKFHVPRGTSYTNGLRIIPLRLEAVALVDLALRGEDTRKTSARSWSAPLPSTALSM